MRQSLSPADRWLCPPLIITIFVLAAVQFYFVAKYAVDLPFWDEWDALIRTMAPPHSSSTLQWVWLKHNDHIIVFTKLTYLVPLTFGTLNFKTIVLYNLLLFYFVVAVYLVLIKRLFPRVPWFVLLSSAVFLFSARLRENNGWAFQNQFHYVLLFYALAVYVLFARLDLVHGLLGGLFGFLAYVSFGTGLPMVLALWCVYLVSLAVTPDEIGRRTPRLLLTLVAVAWIAVVVALTVMLWRPDQSQQLVVPFDVRFWKFLFTLVSSGFGIDFDSLAANASLANSGLIGGTCLIVILAPVVTHLARMLRDGDLAGANFAALAITGGLLIALASISAGRSHSWNIGIDGKSSRYTELSVLLLPLTAAWYWSEAGARLRIAIHVALIAALLGLFSNDWDYDGAYFGWMKPREAAFKCIKDFYLKGTRPMCATVYPAHSLEAYLPLVKDKPYSFVAEAMSR